MPGNENVLITRWRIEAESEEVVAIIEVIGDFEEKRIWSFERDESFANVTCDWPLRADKCVLRTLSLLRKPLFRWNLNRAMLRGLEELRLELARLRQLNTGPNYR